MITETIIQDNKIISQRNIFNADMNYFRISNLNADEYRYNPKLNRLEAEKNNKLYIYESQTASIWY